MGEGMLFRRRRGGQRGNHNSLKNGLYARNFTEEEQQALRKTPRDLKAQIDVLIIIHARVANPLLSSTDCGEDEIRKARLLAQLSVAIGTLMRDQAFIFGKTRSWRRKSRGRSGNSGKNGSWHKSEKGPNPPRA